MTAQPWLEGDERRAILPEGFRERFHILGIPVNRVTREQASTQVERWIQEKGRDIPRLVMTPDTTAVMRARRNSLLKRAYHHADLVTADGTGLVWSSKLWGSPASLPERVTGIDLIESLCQQASRNGYKLFMLGGRPGIASTAAHRLSQRHPALRIVGTHHGYVEDAEVGDLLAHIRRTQPDILLVGMGVPRQERWMLRWRDRLNVPVVMGVGGSFDVLSGRIKRAPALWRRAGLEWFWRALMEPRRLWRARLIPLFMGYVVLHRLGAAAAGTPKYRALPAARWSARSSHPGPV